MIVLLIEEVNGRKIFFFSNPDVFCSKLNERDDAIVAKKAGVDPPNLHTET
jgi:hypothetical protein